MNGCSVIAEINWELWRQVVIKTGLCFRRKTGIRLSSVTGNNCLLLSVNGYSVVNENSSKFLNNNFPRKRSNESLRLSRERCTEIVNYGLWITIHLQIKNLSNFPNNNLSLQKRKLKMLIWNAIMLHSMSIMLKWMLIMLHSMLIMLHFV